MRWPWLTLVALLLVASVAQAQVAREATLVHATTLRFEASDFSSTCDDGVVTIYPDGTGFEFREAPEESPQQSGYEAGMTAAGCGTVSKQIAVPEGADHVHLRFAADRDVTSFTVLHAGQPLEQEVQLRDADGTIVQARPVFDGTAQDRPWTIIDMVHAGTPGPTATVEWTFYDRGFASQTLASNPASGQALVGEVRDVEVMFTGTVPVGQIHEEQQEARDGTTITTQHRVVVAAPEGVHGATALTLRVVPDIRLVDVVAPDGTALGAGVTLAPGQRVGLDTEQVVLDLQPGFTQVTVPHALTQMHGAGDYIFVFQEADSVAVSPALLPLSIVLLLTPLPFAVLAWIEARAFAREAFGGYARSARNLQFGVALVVAYYAAVVLSALVGGRLDLMAWWPMPLEGILLYVQVLMAGVAFTALWLVARELYLLVRPPSTSDDAL